MSAKRIVSLVPSITELLVDLGLETAIVGVTKFCVHPKHLRKNTTIIGGTKNLRLEVIRQLQPDLILANKEENVREQVEALAAEFKVYTSDISNFDDALSMIKTVGELTDRLPEAEALITQINQAKSRFEAVKPNNSKHYRTLYLIWQKPWMSVGGDTYISNMMQIAGFENVCRDRQRYPELSDAVIQSLAPEVILLSSEPFPFTEKHISGLQKLLPEAAILLADGEMFSWYGSRLLQAFDYFTSLRLRI
ncbi:MAG: ABC transporter substrate-binding protein [Bacteroidetes bacterium]|nr:ABC transporter substrate-binding protein [Bacteroidota bacterium]